MTAPCTNRRPAGHAAGLVGNKLPRAAASSESRLFVIERSLAKQITQARIAGSAFNKAEVAMAAWNRRNPKPLRLTADADDADLKAAIDKYGATLVSGILRGVESLSDPVKIRDVCSRVGASDIAPAIIKYELDADEWMKRRVKAERKCRFSQREAAWGRALKSADRLCDWASAIRAITIDGLRCKARMVELNSFGGDPHVDLADSILADLLALRGN